jgi:hypothetical protein
MKGNRPKSEASLMSLRIYRDVSRPAKTKSPRARDRVSDCWLERPGFQPLVADASSQSESWPVKTKDRLKPQVSYPRGYVVAVV